MEAFEDLRSKDALVLVAFPTTGQASSIAAQYLVRQLGLPLVGQVHLPDMQNIVSIQEGRVTSLVRLFGGEVECRLDKVCPRIYIVTADLPIPPVNLSQVADLVLDMASQGEAHLVLCLEGVVRSEGDDTPDVYAASADMAVLKELTSRKIPAMERALIGGIAGPILLGAASRNVRAGALLVEATRDHPDGRAAAALVEALRVVLPHLELDAKPLLKEALELEKELKNAIQASQPQVTGQAQSFI